jgi:ATP-GRASP peptide maturase of grasp-with-spasm system
VLSRNRDIAVDATINWMHFHYNLSVFRITENCDLDVESFNLANQDEITFTNKYDKKIQLKAIKKIWIQGFGSVIKDIACYDKALGMELSKNISGDYNSVLFPLIEYLKSSKRIKLTGSLEIYSLQKISQLIIAKSVGLNVPETHFVTDKQYLKKLKPVSQFITKSFDRSVFIDTPKNHISWQRTELIKKESIDLLGDNFYISFIQKRIDKKYELRIFFFNENYYPMAIFSQSDEKTRVDFRNYNNEKPNRYVPYLLPDEIKKLLIKLSGKLKINSGSYDMIVDRDNRYVFLEVNVCGQFSFVSTNCNYNIEKDLAKYFYDQKT